MKHGRTLVYSKQKGRVKFLNVISFYRSLSIHCIKRKCQQMFFLLQVPQIFICGQLIGGADNLRQLLQTGKPHSIDTFTLVILPFLDEHFLSYQYFSDWRFSKWRILIGLTYLVVQWLYSGDPNTGVVQYSNGKICVITECCIIWMASEYQTGIRSWAIKILVFRFFRFFVVRYSYYDAR